MGKYILYDIECFYSCSQQSQRGLYYSVCFFFLQSPKIYVIKKSFCTTHHEILVCLCYSHRFFIRYRNFSYPRSIPNFFVPLILILRRTYLPSIPVNPVVPRLFHLTAFAHEMTCIQNRNGVYIYTKHQWYHTTTHQGPKFSIHCTPCPPETHHTRVPSAYYYVIYTRLASSLMAPVGLINISIKLSEIGFFFYNNAKTV